MKLTKITEIRENPNNPRVIRDEKFEKLKTSISEFPEMLHLRPIVVNRDMIVIGGNMRFAACKALGLEEVMVIVADDFTVEQEQEFIIKDNVTFGDWDWDNLSANWERGSLNDFGLDIWIQEEEDKEPMRFEDEDEEDDKPKSKGGDGFGMETPERYLEVICPNCATIFNVKAL